MSCTCDKPHTHNKVSDYVILTLVLLLTLVFLVLGLMVTNIHICSEEIVPVLTVMRNPGTFWQYGILLIRSIQSDGNNHT